MIEEDKQSALETDSEGWTVIMLDPDGVYDFDALANWALNNCKGGLTLSANKFRFRDPKEALLFRLKF